MKNFWKMENRFSIEMNLASFYNRIYLCSTFDEYHRNIWLDFPQGRCLPTPPSSLLEGSYFNPIERLLNRCEIKYKSLDFSTASPIETTSRFSRDWKQFPITNYFYEKKKKKSRTNEWMDGKICYRVSSSLVGKCAIGVSCGFMARQPTRPQTGNSTWEITRYHLAQLILIKKRNFLERNTTTLRCQQQRVQLFRSIFPSNLSSENFVRRKTFDSTSGGSIRWNTRFLLSLPNYFNRLSISYPSRITWYFLFIIR